MARGQTEFKLALTRLSDVAHDMSRMLAVHEERLDNHERQAVVLQQDVERRRTEISELAEKVYKSIENQVDEIKKEIKKQEDSSATRDEKLSAKIALLEKYLWMAVGAISIISWVGSIAVKFLAPAH
jgi:chromosome segregation ATPase